MKPTEGEDYYRFVENNEIMQQEGSEVRDQRENFCY